MKNVLVNYKNHGCLELKFFLYVYMNAIWDRHAKLEHHWIEDDIFFIMTCMFNEHCSLECKTAHYRVEAC